MSRKSIEERKPLRRSLEPSIQSDSKTEEIKVKNDSNETKRPTKTLSDGKSHNIVQEREKLERRKRPNKPPRKLDAKGKPFGLTVTPEGAVVVPKRTLIAPRLPIKEQKAKRQLVNAKFGSEESAALSRRVATTNRVGVKELIESRLKKKSPWYDSIMNPIGGGGVKIPDPIGTDTGTYQHVQNVTVGVTAGGTAGLRIISPWINAFGGGPGFNYQITSTGSTSAGLQWGNANFTLVGFPFAIVPGLMQANAHLHRVVSCAVICQTEVSTLSDAGEMCAFVTPLDCNSNTVAYTTYQQQWDTTLMPVNAHKPLIARWYPVEGEFDFYNGTAPVHNGTVETISYRDFMDPLDNFTGGVIPFEVGCVCTGMTASTGVVRFQIIVNYEFIPLLSSAMVDAKPSPVDPMEEQLVTSWVSKDPITSVVPLKVASQAPASTSVPEEATGFGMFTSVLEEIIPTLVGSLGSKALAML